ncbi:MAG: protein translocase subunit SecD [Desulfobacterota bacterium]|nr:protein translocase subunit SecD [Thermodesulfobacteriota bacterium]
MGKSLKWRLILYLAVTLFALLLFLPSVVPELPDWYFKVIPTEKVHLGLDLQGGMHLVLEVEAEKAVESYLERVKNDLREDLRDKGIPVGKIETERNGRLLLEVAGEKAKWEKVLSQRYSAMQELSTTALGQGVWKVVLVLDSRQADQIRRNAIDQALETIRNRIDQFGVAEPEITLQGTDRILIQLPGIRDPQRAIDLIGRTALLEFKLVDEEGDLEEALKGNVPEGSIVLYQRQVDPKTGGVKKVPYLLKEKTLMTGEVLKDARVAIDTQLNEPYVALEFDDVGAKLFEQITGANVKKRLAIILDDNVYSAPVIQERISGGRAQITGRFDMKEASDLAIVLRAGALPAPVKILEQRSVGPSLGQDSIRQGILSVVISAILVALFMIFYYRLSGVIADVALLLNILLVLGALAIFRATLTLPGIAGLVLSIGMAVDANILIHERIKEELRWGKTIRAAIDEGYRRAFLTILDSNLTTLIAALFLYQFGTGPVRGFAVTLSIGILANIFTAVYVTRWVFDFLTLKVKVKRLSI